MRESTSSGALDTIVLTLLSFCHPIVLHTGSQMQSDLTHENSRLARRKWGRIVTKADLRALTDLTEAHKFSVASGDVRFLNGGWYVTHIGLIRLARRNRCVGIHSSVLKTFSDATAQRWAFKATVFKNAKCKGFVGYGDADLFNTSDLVRGAEMRVAETRAVNRALRKAYGIGICSVEEIGSFEKAPKRPVRKIPPQSAGKSSSNGGSLNGEGTRVRDRLCQIIRQHKLDPELVKAYAVDFCGAKALRDASRQQVENFVAHLADWAAKEHNALLSKLNGYAHQNAGVA